MVFACVGWWYSQREETAQREAAKKREEVLLQRERERDRLRQDKASAGFLELVQYRSVIVLHGVIPAKPVSPCFAKTILRISQRLE